MGDKNLIPHGLSGSRKKKAHREIPHKKQRSWDVFTAFSLWAGRGVPWDVFTAFSSWAGRGVPPEPHVTPWMELLWTKSTSPSICFSLTVAVHYMAYSHCLPNNQPEHLWREPLFSSIFLCMANLSLRSSANALYSQRTLGILQYTPAVLELMAKSQ